MTVTESQVQALIVLEVGEVWQPAAAPGGQPIALLASNMATIWASVADKALIAPRLQELYAKRRCIDLVLATLRDQVNFSVANDYRSDQSDRSKHLQQMRDDCQAEIEKVETLARSGGAASIGLIAATTPTLPPPPVTSPYTYWTGTRGGLR